VEGGVHNSWLIAERERRLNLKDKHLPKFQVPEARPSTAICRSARGGADQRFAESRARRRIDASAIRATRARAGVIIRWFLRYFLIVQDFINWGQSERHPGGAGARVRPGSLAAYSLCVTDIDPIPYNLLFERFLIPSACRCRISTSISARTGRGVIAT